MKLISMTIATAALLFICLAEPVQANELPPGYNPCDRGGNEGDLCEINFGAGVRRVMVAFGLNDGGTWNNYNFLEFQANDGDNLQIPCEAWLFGDPAYQQAKSCGFKFLDARADGTFSECSYIGDTFNLFPPLTNPDDDFRMQAHADSPNGRTPLDVNIARYCGNHASDDPGLFLQRSALYDHVIEGQISPFPAKQILVGRIVQVAELKQNPSDGKYYPWCRTLLDESCQISKSFARSVDYSNVNSAFSAYNTTSVSGPTSIQVRGSVDGTPYYRISQMKGDQNCDVTQLNGLPYVFGPLDFHFAFLSMYSMWPFDTPSMNSMECDVGNGIPVQAYTNVTGSWVQKAESATGEAIMEEISVGRTFSKEVSNSTSFTASIQDQVEAGLSIEVLTAKNTVTFGFSAQLSSSLSNTISSSESNSTSVTCAASDPPTNIKVFVFQAETADVRDAANSSTFQSTTFACGYGMADGEFPLCYPDGLITETMNNLQTCKDGGWIDPFKNKK